MRISRVVAAVAGASLLLVGLVGCGATPPVVTPVVVEANDIQGAEVSVPLNSTLVINTGSLPVDSYTAKIADESIATFVQGREDGNATFSPGLAPHKVGKTEVTLTNARGGIQPLTFTVKVTPVAAGSDLGGSGR